MNIQPIVEGHGDVEAVPVLLRRLLIEIQAPGIGVNRAIRQKQSQLLNQDSLKQAVQLARLHANCGAILILFEAEDNCPKTLGPTLLKWAQSQAREIPCAVALAHREYEAWFLAAIESLRGKRWIRTDVVSPADPEAPRDAKGALEKLMAAGHFYSETADQPALSEELFDMKESYIRSRSFRHLIKVFGELVSGMGGTVSTWPPPDWVPQQ